ncbi:MAG TPA: hypothetical protein VKE40_21675 [Gemmataceae bacterium]|nr:hypothetical protein [Gemmataceae bacterium]
MQWNDLFPNLLTPAIATVTLAIAFRNWHRSRKGSDLRHACMMAALVAGIALVTAFFIVRRAFNWDLYGPAAQWAELSVVGGLLLAGFLFGRALSNRANRPRASPPEQDYDEDHESNPVGPVTPPHS